MASDKYRECVQEQEEYAGFSKQSVDVLSGKALDFLGALVGLQPSGMNLDFSERLAALRTARVADCMREKGKN